mmetsp:Transcript_43692/g.42214  ORF Transcript_43692/g.42214 Transcript_43692/m.42214 type:complete len:94 (-) Transcript_43692:1068-1349(-)
MRLTFKNLEDPSTFEEITDSEEGETTQGTFVQNSIFYPLLMLLFYAFCCCFFQRLVATRPTTGKKSIIRDFQKTLKKLQSGKFSDSNVFNALV